MMTGEATWQETRRKQRRQRIARRRRQSQTLSAVIKLFCVVCIGVVCAGVIESELSEPRRFAELAQYVESQGGEVTKIASPGGYRIGGPSYVDVVFDSQQSRCSYVLLDKTPRSLQCDPAINP
jgi:hypothetical protein